MLYSILAVAAVTASAIALKVVDGAECDCYLIDGSSPTYYTSHGFWDFRALSQHAGVPAKITTIEGNRNADLSSAYFGEESEFGKFWGPQNWDNGDEDFPMINSYNNLYIEANDGPESDTFLTMRTFRRPSFQSAAEFESIEILDHASMRMSARTIGSPGACTAMFTYLGAESLIDVQESDIEVLTADPDTYIEYTNQPSYLEDGTTIDGSSHNVSMPDGTSWSSWAVHRLDWTPGMTTWSVDGEETFAMDFQAPVDPAQVIFNAWSDGGDWTGKMPVGGAAYQQIQWIELLYGVTEGSSCQNVCSVDKTSAVGKPVLL